MFNRRGLLAFFFALALLIFGFDQWSKLVVVESMEIGDRIQFFEFFASSFCYSHFILLVGLIQVIPLLVFVIADDLKYSFSL